MHGQFYTDTVGPGSKDHLALTTAFPCTAGWSLKPGFNVHAGTQSPRHHTHTHTHTHKRVHTHTHTHTHTNVHTHTHTHTHARTHARAPHAHTHTNTHTHAHTILPGVCTDGRPSVAFRLVRQKGTPLQQVVKQKSKEQTIIGHNSYNRLPLLRVSLCVFAGACTMMVCGYLVKKIKIENPNRSQK